MPTAGHGVLRASRAALATLLVLGLAVSAHSGGGGHVPGVAAWLVLGALVAPVAWWATRRRLGALPLLILLGGAQTLVHGALLAMAPTSGGSASAHVHGAVPVGLGPEAAHTAHVPGTSMVLAHVVGTVVSALLLARAEDVLWRLVASLLPVLPDPARPPFVGRPTPAPAPRPLAGRPVRPVGGRAPPAVLI
ncbi:hypothetical protein JQN72_10595 [Phycicoccus sp. CSK15P-2]|uniref:hypothetical protein n=1 Tax=Phycicoccus sp. CSK15P-2 TaxID=2807627 RepID=UPI0019503176|nr:hypothetical protein [Phycicoccus sp. CSK15P-2]MBM6404689.1 hypothetical protein [Phycicoccus sp. CSK15P-2]